MLTLESPQRGNSYPTLEQIEIKRVMNEMITLSIQYCKQLVASIHHKVNKRWAQSYGSYLSTFKTIAFNTQNGLKYQQYK